MSLDIHILENGQPVGPLTEGQLRAMIASGRVGASTPCWYEGLDQWRPLADCRPELVARPAGPPELPPVSAEPARAGVPTKAREARPKTPSRLRIANEGFPTGPLVSAGAGCLLFGILAILLLSALVPAGGDWGLLPSVVSSLISNGPGATLDPAPLPPPETPAVDVQPAPGLRLSAPAGHLDRPREFRATRMSERELEQLVEVTANTAAAAVAGFDIDSAMAPGDRFAAPVTLTFDLATLGLSEDLWHHLAVARVDPDGKLQYHVSELRQSSLECEIGHNSPFVLMLVAIVGLKGLYVVDQVSKGALDDTIGDNVDPYFRIEWPTKLGARDTVEHGRLNDTLAVKWKEYQEKKMPAVTGLRWPARLNAYLTDPVVKDAYRKLHDIEWKKKHYYPYSIVHGVEALQHAGSYLFEHRRFRKRGERIEVYFLDPWPYPNTETFAYQKDGHFTYPYVHVNLTKVPNVAAAASAQDREALDNLNVTLVHEIFHAVQKEYYNWTKYMNPGQVWGGGVNHWFMEATALVLEEEAKDYYIGKGWVQDFPLTADNLYASQKSAPGESRKKLRAQFKLPLDRSVGRAGEGERGYAASQFLLTLRDRYFGMNRDRFLPRTLEAFGTFRAGPVDALLKTTSNSALVFGADYHLFCAQHASDILDEYDPKTPEVALTRAEPLHHWTLEGPLSSPCRIFRLHGIDAADMDKAKVVIRTNAMQDEGIFVRQRTGANFETVTERSRVIPMSTLKNLRSPEKKIELQRVETNVRPLDLDSHGYRRETTVLALLPPKKPPKVTLDDEKEVIKVEIPPSKLFKAGEVKEIRVRFQRPGRKKPLTFSLGAETTGEIAWRQIFGLSQSAAAPADLFGVFTLQEFQDMMDVWAYLKGLEGAQPVIQLSYLEVISEPLGGYQEGKGIEGPESEIFTVPVEGARFGSKYPVDGTWVGKIWIARTPLTLTLTQSGSGIEGHYTHGKERHRLSGTWNEKEDAWVVSLFVKEGNQEYPALIELYLRRLPEEKLWLAAPPCVLRRPEPEKPEKKGWFGWW